MIRRMHKTRCPICGQELIDSGGPRAAHFGATGEEYARAIRALRYLEGMLMVLTASQETAPESDWICATCFNPEPDCTCPARS